MIADRSNIDVAIRVSLFASILNKKKKINTLVISDYKNNTTYNIYKIFGIFKILNFTDYFKKNLFNLIIFLKFILLALKFILGLVFSKNYLNKFINRFKIQNIVVGDIIYDIYIRYNNNYLRCNNFNLHFVVNSLKNIYIVLSRLIFLEKIFNKYEIDTVLSSSLGDISSGNLLIRFASYKRKKTIFLSGQTIKEYKKYQDCFTNTSRFSNLELKKLSYIYKISKIKKYIKNKFYKFKVNLNKQYYVRPETFISAYSGQELTGKLKVSAYKSKKKIDLNKINFSKKKKMCLFALNCFSDSPHCNGKILFRDFYDHFVQTINFVKKQNTEEIFWLVKPPSCYKIL